MSWLKLMPALLAVGLVGFVAYAFVEPVSVLGYDDEALAESLEDALPDFGRAECTERGPVWTCSIEIDAGSGFGAGYELLVGEDGCWAGTPGGNRRVGPRQLAGCVDLLDIIGTPEPLN